MNSSHTNSPGCEAGLMLGDRLQQPSPFVQALLIFIVIIDILTFPFTVVLNALVMIAVKTKSRLRAHKSNILLAMLASTDIAVGILLQPVFIAVLVMFLLDEPKGYCLLRVFRLVIGGLVHASLYHLALISVERYLAMKHPFAYTNLVTEARLLVASAFAWLLPVFLQMPILFNLNTVVMSAFNTFTALSIVVIAFCHVTVYCEIRRHKKQIAVQQATQEAREQFEKDKKIFKLTSIILGLLLLCFIPFGVFTIVAFRYRSKITLEIMHIFFSFATSIMLLNSLINPIIYSVRMRQFRVAFIELVCTTVNIAEAEEFEMRYFGAPNVVVRFEAGQEHEGQDQPNVEQVNVNNNDTHNDDVRMPQDENYGLRQPNNNSHTTTSDCSTLTS